MSIQYMQHYAALRFNSTTKAILYSLLLVFRLSHASLAFSVSLNTARRLCLSALVITYHLVIVNGAIKGDHCRADSQSSPFVVQTKLYFCTSFKNGIHSRFWSKDVHVSRAGCDPAIRTSLVFLTADFHNDFFNVARYM